MSQQQEVWLVSAACAASCCIMLPPSAAYKNKHPQKCNFCEGMNEQRLKHVSDREEALLTGVSTCFNGSCGVGGWRENETGG